MISCSCSKSKLKYEHIRLKLLFSIAEEHHRTIICPYTYITKNQFDVLSHVMNDKILGCHCLIKLTEASFVSYGTLWYIQTCFR